MGSSFLNPESMLLRNGKQHELSTAEQASLTKEFAGFPQKAVIIKYPEVAYKKTNGNLLPDSPAGRHLPLVGTLMEKGIPVEYRYYETVVQRKDAANSYLPKNLSLTQQKPIENMELLWFLWNVSPYSTNGKNADANKTGMFEFENLEKEAETFIENEAIELRARVFITDAEIGLKDDQVTKVAKSYGLIVTGFTPNQVRKVLYEELRNKAKRERGNAEAIWKDLVERAKINDLVIIKSEIQDAIDDKKIQFVPTAKKFYFLDKGEPTSEVHKDPITKASAHHGLYEIFTNNEKELEEFRKAMKSDGKKEKEDSKK